MITGFYAGVSGLMLAALILRVALRRMKYRVGLGDGGIADLSQAIRAHGNFVETVPIMLIILGVMELNLTAPPILHGYGILMLVSRVLHMQGIASSPEHSFGRKTGMIMTLSLLVIGSLIIIKSYLFKL